MLIRNSSLEFIGTLIIVTFSYSVIADLSFPILQTLTLLVRAAAFDVLEPELLKKLHDAIFKEVAETSDFVKVGSSVPLLIALLSLQHIKHRCIESVLLLLKHPWPRIRSITAQQLFEFVIAHNSFVDEDTKFEKLTEILSITQWDGDSTAVDEGIAAVCQLLDVAIPSKTLNSTIVDKVVESEEFNYDALVNEVGY